MVVQGLPRSQGCFRALASDEILGRKLYALCGVRAGLETTAACA